jgi:putative tricarboxylic transport membrane protein
MVMQRYAEFIAGLVLASFGGFVIYAARDLPYSSEFGPGPGFFPLWIGIGILACSLFIIFTYFAHAKGADGNGQAITIGMRRALGAWSAFAITLAILPRAGFVLSLALLTAFLILVLERRSAWVALGVALCLAFGFHVIFTLGLGLSLPAGPWGF